MAQVLEFQSGEAHKACKRLLLPYYERSRVWNGQPRGVSVFLSFPCPGHTSIDILATLDRANGTIQSWAPKVELALSARLDGVSLILWHSSTRGLFVRAELGFAR